MAYAGGGIPHGAMQVGVSLQGLPEYAARARLGDGSLRPGRVTTGDSFSNGCHVACKCGVGDVNPPSIDRYHLRLHMALAVGPLELSASAFEVLLGAAPGYVARMVPWLAGTPVPQGAVVVGVSPRGDPLLCAVVERVDPSGTRLVSAGYASVHDSKVTFAFGESVHKLPW